MSYVRESESTMQCVLTSLLWRNFANEPSNSVIFIGAGVLGRSSWLDRQVVENFEKVEFRTDYPRGEVVQRNCA